MECEKEHCDRGKVKEWMTTKNGEEPRMGEDSVSGPANALKEVMSVA